MLQTIETKQATVDESLKTLTDFREKLGERNKEVEQIETTINVLNNRILRLDGQIKASTTKIDLLNHHIRTLKSRKEEYENTLESVTKRLTDLETVREEEETRATSADKKTVEYSNLKEQHFKEVDHANGVAKRAALALAEIESQRDMAENLAADDKALCLIEEMAEAGTVTGVYGRLAEIIKVKNGYSKPIEAAAAGWMKAIVVKDMETAISCIEVLKKTKVGRVKLIPLRGLAKPHKVQIPKENQEIIGPIVDQLEFDESYRTAVDYVFGDTVLTANQKSAFLASLKGVRAVATTGDLYEPGGGMETGFFRQPLDMSKLLLNGETVVQLRSTLSSLEKMAAKANEEIGRLGQEILDQSKSKSQSLNLIGLTDREISTFKENLDRAGRVVEETAERLEQLAREIGTEQVILEACKSLKERLQGGPLGEYERTRDSLKVRSQSAEVMEKENEHSRQASEFNALVHKKIEIESRIQSLKSTVAILEPTIEQAKTQTKAIDSQLLQLADELPRTRSKLLELEDRLKQAQNEPRPNLPRTGGRERETR